MTIPIPLNERHTLRVFALDMTAACMDLLARKLRAERGRAAVGVMV